MSTLSLNEVKSLRKPRIGVSATFFIMGIVSMSWIPRIPEIKHALHFNDGQFGLILITGSVGAGIGAQFSGRLVHRFGTRTIVRTASFVMASAAIFIGLSHSAFPLVCSLFLSGFSYSTLDIAINTQAVALERLLNKRVMVGFHGSWSLGSLVVAFIGSQAIKHNVSPERYLITIGTSAIFIYQLLVFLLLHREHDDHPSTMNDTAEEKAEKAKLPYFGKKVIPLWWLGLGTIAALIFEGSVGDWSGILLKENYHFTKVVSTTGFASFAAAMIISRFSGDFFIHKFGPEKIIKYGAYISGIGIGVGVLTARFTYSSHPALALIMVDLGFFCGGIGLGPMFPSFLLSAGSIEGIPPAVAMSRMGVIGISTYFLGPSLIGGFAQIFTLPFALIYPTVLLIIVGVFAHKMVQHHIAN